MAPEADDTEQEDDLEDKALSQKTNGRMQAGKEGTNSETTEEAEEEDEEPRLNYASLTKHLKPVYRNGDATSAFMVGGDKMVRRPRHVQLADEMILSATDDWYP